MKNALLSLMSSIQGTHSGYTLFEMIEILSEFHIMLLPFSKKNKEINAHTCILCKIFLLRENYSYFAQVIYLIDKTDKIPCAILEWSDTIPELRNQVGILTLHRAILEWYRFLLCSEHIYFNKLR